MHGVNAFGKSGRPQGRIGEQFLAQDGSDGIVHCAPRGPRGRSIPAHGECVFRLSGLRRDEPSPDLFKVPANFRIASGK